MKAFDQLTERGQHQRRRRLAEAALAAFGIKAEQLTFINHGENTTYRVKTAAADGSQTGFYRTGYYLLRLHGINYNSAAEINSELQWLKALAEEAKLPVPLPVAGLDGRYVQSVQIDEIPHRYNCSLMEWLDGRLQINNPTPAHCQQLGLLVGQLHQHAQAWVLSSNFQRRSWDWEGQFGANVSNGADHATVWAAIPAEHHQLLQQTMDDFAEVECMLGKGRDVYGLIHADPHWGNILFADGAARAIDFDDCGFGYWLYDLAIAVGRWRITPQWDGIWQNFLKGYRQLQTWDQAASQLLDVIIAARCTNVLQWYVGHATYDPLFASDVHEVIETFTTRIRTIYLHPPLAR
ncbi:phosphotransferase enzyme family protein [Herpetosiphon llansteffanensis]